MKLLTRDISVTLAVKLVLLILLWFIFVRGIGKPVKDAQQWMLGATVSDTHLSVKKGNL